MSNAKKDPTVDRVFIMMLVGWAQGWLANDSPALRL